jgi:murein DD-endopeptidase MepM/ murein hydrolase activator NlpD
MLRRANQKHLRRLLVASSLAMSLIFIVSGIGLAAYRIGRPIADGGGVINQGYLYGEEATVNGTLVRHKGIDFSYLTGTHVYAVADGTVVDIANGYQNGDRSSVWGNFVLIRHDQRHYDRTTGQWAYVYSMYLHLSQWSVRVAETAHVSAGDWIADSDDTGSGSGGQHFHLQIVVNSQPDRTLEPSTLESETRSRNPELWLQPYNGNTGTVIGKVTYTNGTPYPGVTIYGALSGHNADGLAKNPAWDYETNLTYVDARFNPDDILLENWGTTDVTPGRYHVTTNLGGDLGWHTVVAGQVTYVGLFPVWLPYVRSKNGWNSTLTIHNNSSTYRAQVNITFFNRDGTVSYQRPADYIPARSLATIGVPAGFDGGALVVSSEDVAVAVREESGTELNEYNGIMASTNGLASLGWERAGSTVYIPVVKNAHYGRSSKLFIMNTGPQPTTANAQFYNTDSGLAEGNVVSNDLAPNASVSVRTSECAYPSNRCSARVTSSNGQPLAVAVFEQDDATTLSRVTYNGFSAGTGTSFVPLLKNVNYGMLTGLAVHNLGASPTTVTVTCYDALQTYSCGSTNVPGRGTAVLTAWPVPPGWVGWAVVTSSSQNIVTAIYESGSPKQMVTNAPSSGTSLAYAPELYGGYVLNGQTWDSGISLQNASSSNANVTVTYYDQPGNQIGSWTRNALPPRAVWILNRWAGNLPSGFVGSAVITANQPVVAIVNVLHTGSGDTNASYTAPNR